MVRKTDLKVIPGGRRRRVKVWRRLFALGMVVLAGFLFYSSLGQFSLLLATDTVARHGQISHGVLVDCTVLRNEHTVLAPGPGTYIPLVETGTRVRKGQSFARIQGPGGALELTAPVPGLVHHGSDELGQLLTLDTQLNEEMVATMAQLAPPLVESASTVQSNQAVATIIDNSRFQVVTDTPFHSPDKKQALKVEAGTDEMKIELSPRDVILVDACYWVVWDAPALPDSLGLERKFSARLITGQQDLVLIPQDALYTRDGELGVFVLYRNKPVFNKVEVHYTEDGIVGVTGLTNGQRVLSLPKWASFLRRWW